MVPFVFWVLGMAVAILLGLLTHLTPALYHLCVFFERHIVLALERERGRTISLGGLILASLLAWGALGALVGGLLLAPQAGGWAVVVFGAIAAFWGASVGYQVGVQNLIFAYRQPGVLPEHHPGHLGRSQAAHAERGHDTSLDELLEESIILGEAAEHE